ncbi:hypothetical protein MKW94_030152 [Papaver nudicaule]|uniref:glutathione transferase n=1 Tax=Papaver nudicaule TaxID=74823 RepID=A0AA41VHP3_PAPNU|nr:hypothetical protein [Papaver nudicaule]
MGVKLYGIPLSTPTACVMTCLAEKDIEYELVPIQRRAQNPNSPRKKQSRAITAYISHKYQSGTDLFRHDNVEEAAMVGVWVEVESQQFNPPADTIIYNLLVKPFIGQTTDQSAVDASVVKLGLVLDVYEARLSNSKYLACDSFTLADLHHIPYIHYLFKTPHADLITSRAHVNAWWEDISARPSFVKVAEQVDAFIPKA